VVLVVLVIVRPFVAEGEVVAATGALAGRGSDLGQIPSAVAMRLKLAWPSRDALPARSPREALEPLGEHAHFGFRRLVGKKCAVITDKDKDRRDIGCI
jgi:hypothetical protein